MAEFDITAAIMTELKSYNADVEDGIERAADECAKGMRAEIRQNSPKGKTKSYSRGWRVKTIRGHERAAAKLVYNATDYQLTHLLEKPHFVRGRKRKTDGQPHIAPAADKWNNAFAEKCEEVCKR